MSDCASWTYREMLDIQFQKIQRKSSLHNSGQSWARHQQKVKFVFMLQEKQLPWRVLFDRGKLLHNWILLTELKSFSFLWLYYLYYSHQRHVSVWVCLTSQWRLGAAMLLLLAEWGRNPSFLNFLQSTVHLESWETRLRRWEETDWMVWWMTWSLWFLLSAPSKISCWLPESL